MSAAPPAWRVTRANAKAMMAREGFIVPWNATWTGEIEYKIRPCKYADNMMAIWQATNIGVGRPIFAKPHFIRQRMSIAKLICTVCGEHTPPDDRWWFAHGTWVEDMWMTTEAPVHHDCAELSLLKCPHLRSSAAILQPFPKTCTVMKAIIGGDLFAKDFGFEIPSGVQVVGSLKFAWNRSQINIEGA